jgi:hypothetical protein
MRSTLCWASWARHRHLLAGGEQDIGPDTLARFGTERIVVKVVSPDAPHKQKLGGVKVVYKDLDFVRWTVREMREEFERRGQRVEGVLLVEFVRYAPVLGNEISGFRESDAFGPVLSFSKGGEDAEHFATHFSPPNLVLLPVDREWASALLASTHIHKKYLAEGRQEHIDRIVDAEVPEPLPHFSCLGRGGAPGC